jgi:hypothetical protein
LLETSEFISQSESGPTDISKLETSTYFLVFHVPLSEYESVQTENPLSVSVEQLASADLLRQKIEKKMAINDINLYFIVCNLSPRGVSCNKSANFRQAAAIK